MSISYPISPPSTPAPVTQTWSIDRRTGVSQSPFTGVEQTVEFGFRKWKAVVTLPPMNKATASGWISFFTKLHGRRGTFFLGDADRKTPRGSVSGTVTINTATTIGDTIITIAGTTGFKEGDMIQIGSASASRLHMVVADQSGSSIQIEPAVKAVFAQSTPITYTNPVGIFRMDSDTLSWDTNVVSNYGISFSCTEVD